MAGFVFSSAADTWPAGTTVSAYLPSTRGESSATSGAAVTSAVVAADGSLTFTGLADDTAYVASDGTRSKRFRSVPVVGGGRAAAWAANTFYPGGTLVVQGGVLYRAKADFTSGAAFAVANWDAVGQPVSPTWLPSSIAGLQAWFDFSSSVTLTDGQAITTWQDLSGNVRTLSVAGGKTAPVWKSGIQNGRGVARFNGVDTGLDSVAFAAALVQPFTAFVVGRASLGTSATECFLSDGGGSPSIYALLGGNYGIGTGTPAFRSVQGGSKQNQMVVLSAVAGGTGLSLIRQNGVLVASFTPDTATDTLTKVSLGYGNGFLSGDIGEVLVYSGRLSDVDIAAVETYLS